MDFTLNENQKMIQNMVKRFVKDKLAPIAADIDKKGEFPKKIVKELGKQGIMGISVPSQWGGSEMDVVSYAIAVEEISRGCASTGVIVSVNNSLVCDPILQYGNDYQKEEFLTPLASGKKLGCFALTEPGAGSDALNQKTVAVKDGDYYIINGSKNFITNASEADIAIVIAVTDKNATKKSRSISAFIVDMKSEGVSIGKIEDKLGIKGASSCSIIFEDVKVPANQLLGNEGDGFKIAMTTLDGGRIGIAAQALGIAQSALDDAVAYSKERKQFNQYIHEFQGIQFMMAEMSTKLEAARLLVYKSAYLKEIKDPNYGTFSAMAKLYAAETASFIATKGIQIHGGYGYTKDYPAERHFRDARITEIYEGTSEIQKIVIARSLLKN
ncbi:acyl-CoA dehydrogenase [bacterium]|nr:acyl-CoA dehydrogenase [bacterium]